MINRTQICCFPSCYLFGSSHCISLLSINIPPSVLEIDEDAFKNCRLLRNVAISPETDLMEYIPFPNPRMFPALSESLFYEVIGGSREWDCMPLHAFCFYHSRQEAQAKEYNSNPLEWLDENEGWMVSEDYSEVDGLGMTPLHILACSGTHDIRLYHRIFDVCPDALTVKDKWGETPLGYALLSGAPKDVLHFLLKMHKQTWGIFPFDFGKKIKHLALCKSAECIRGIIQAQRTYFPELEVNWHQIVNKSMQSESNESIYCKTPISVFRVLVEASVSSRMVCMSLDQQHCIDEWIAKLMLIYSNPPKYFSRNRLVPFLYHLKVISDDDTALDYDRLIGFSEKSRLALFKKC